jgi:cytochrome P450
MNGMAGFGDWFGDRARRTVAGQPRSLRASIQQGAITAPERFFDFRNVSGLKLLRSHRPIARIGTTFVVARRHDVLAVLEDPRTFPTPYTSGLAAGFVLGLTGAKYDEQKAALGAALRAPALDVGSHARSCVDRVESDRLAVGSELVRPVLVELVSRYLGVRELRRESLIRWTQAIFQDIFLNNYQLSCIHERAEDATRQFRAAVRSEVRARRQALDMPGGRGPVTDDMLTRLLTPARGRGLSEDQIVDNLIGLAIGWLWHGAKAAILAVDGLLDRPHALSLARTAAQAGEREELRRIIWEVLRFRPVQVGVPRTCARAAVLGAGTPHRTDIPAGAIVLAGTHSAMWDETAIPDPHHFDPTRSDQQYLIFGHGTHKCMGEPIMRRQLPELLMPLLARDGLTRASGRPGRLSWVGPSPDDLWVEFSPVPYVV